MWDTGATGSVITQKVVDACELKPVGTRRVYHAQGEEDVPVFLVNIKLPNNVEFHGLPVTWGTFPGADVLIGMDIIRQGDFAVTNLDGKTTFSFRMPSKAKIDFVAEDRRAAVLDTQSRPSDRTRQKNRQKRKRNRKRH